MLESIHLHQTWREHVLEEEFPENDWNVLPVFVKNGRSPYGTPYVATMWFPPTWLLDSNTGFFINPLAYSQPTVKPITGERGKWLMLSSAEMGPEVPGSAVFIKQVAFCKWAIVGGECPELVGARITHLWDKKDYKSVEAGVLEELLNE